MTNFACSFYLLNVNGLVSYLLRLTNETFADSGHEIDNVFDAKRSCFVDVLCMFSSFTLSVGRFTREATMESEMPVQVEVGNTRRVFLMHFVDELNKAITSSIFKMRFSTFGILDENDEGEYHKSTECSPFSQITWEG